MSKSIPQPSTQPEIHGRAGNRADLHASFIRCVRLLIAGSIFHNQTVADRFGLRLSDMQCINLLDLLGPSTPGELARATGLSTGGVTLMLDRLEKENFVKREANPRDRRSILVRVNSGKLKKVNGFYETINQQMGDLLASTPESELRSALNLFTKMIAFRTEKIPLASPRGKAR